MGDAAGGGVVEELRRMNDRNRRDLGRISDRLDEMATLLGGLPPVLPAKPARRRPPPPRGPAPVASTFERESQSDGTALFHIDGKDLVLPLMLDDLLSELAAQEPDPASDLVAWKSLERLAARLSKRSGRKLTKRALAHLIYRLRTELEQAGLDRRLVQTHRRNGRRFAVKYRPLTVIKDDHA